jgi:signal peptidase II
MEKLHRSPLIGKRDILFGIIAVIVIIADQLTKYLIVHFIPENTVFWDAGIFQIVHITNTGVSFGLFKGFIWVIVTVVFLEMALILAFEYLLRSRLAFLESILMRVGLGLVMGGAIGNQIDRLINQRVTDFVDFKFWPVFNVADSCAVVGTIIIAYCIIFKSGLLKSKHE